MNNQSLTCSVEIIIVEDKPLIGSHLSKRKTLEETVRTALEYSINCMQFYTSSPKGYAPARLDVDDAKRAGELMERYNFHVFIHGCLLYNLFGCSDETSPNYDRNLGLTRSGLAHELDIAVAMTPLGWSLKEAVGVVVHIGAAKCGPEKAIPRIAKTITETLLVYTSYTCRVADSLGISVQQVKRRRRVILENAAGEENKIGSHLPEIRSIIDLVDETVRDQVFVCIDTAHLFGAGDYNIRQPEEMLRFLADVEEIIGIDRMAVFHLNDSALGFGSHRDSHMNLFRGHIFAEVLVEERMKGRKKIHALSIGPTGIQSLSALIGFSNENSIPLIIESPESSIPDIDIVREIGNM